MNKVFVDYPLGTIVQFNATAEKGRVVARQFSVTLGEYNYDVETKRGILRYQPHTSFSVVEYPKKRELVEPTVAVGTIKPLDARKLALAGVISAGKSRR